MAISQFKGDFCGFPDSPDDDAGEDDVVEEPLLNSFEGGIVRLGGHAGLEVGADALQARLGLRVEVVEDGRGRPEERGGQLQLRGELRVAGKEREVVSFDN